jgi:hypothetical protein
VTCLHLLYFWQTTIHGRRQHHSNQLLRSSAPTSLPSGHELDP